MTVKLGLLAAAAISSVVGFNSPPISSHARSSADVAALAEVRLKLASPCEWRCFECPGLEEHSLISGGPYVGQHPENCVPDGSCVDHFCTMEEDQDREDFAAFVAELR
jgi:NAD-dependent dihydropyrimidine dehydrogenase PreA subunit